MPVHPNPAPAPPAPRHVSKAADVIRVVLADNHTAMRRSLRLLLDGEQDMQVVAEAGDLAMVMLEVHKHRPQVLVLDLGMYNGSSIEAIGRLRREVPGSEIVVLTMEQAPAFARRAIDAGAIGFVLKDAADSDLPDAVRGAAHGEPYVSACVESGLYSLRQGALIGT
jgi:two-component system, NarL family, response regulator NreC